MPPATPRFLYFDLGKVLLDFDHRVGCRHLASHAGVSEELVWETIFESGIEWRYERGEISSREFLERVRESIPTLPDFDTTLALISDIFVARPDVEEILDQLARRNHRMGVLSNTCEAHWQHLYPNRFPFLRERFRVHALSFELRAMKPEPAIYQQALELAGVSAAETFFVDDRLENVDAAARLGIDALQFHSAEQLADELAARGLLA
jgi:HAD superfamily hydrolase (TIGR01509 family)